MPKSKSKRPFLTIQIQKKFKFSMKQELKINSHEPHKGSQKKTRGRKIQKIDIEHTEVKTSQ